VKNGMMIKKFKTDFDFKDARNYVHSSSLISSFFQIVFSEFPPISSWENPVSDLKFAQEAHHNGVFTFGSHKEELPLQESVSAHFKIYDSEKCVYAVFQEKPEQVILKRIKTNYQVQNMVLNGDFSGECNIGCMSFDGLIENVIEANKQVHLQTLSSEGKTLKVVNVYMKNFPVFVKQPYEETSLKITNKVARRRGNSISTMNIVSFPEKDFLPFEISYIVYMS
jgi:hypothetical protein